jgi:membrane protease YdiL (CAAX protease family)
MIYVVLIGAFIWYLHRGLGKYPAPLPKSHTPKREIQEVLLLWGVAAIIPILRMFVINTWLNASEVSRIVQELIYLPLLTLIYLLFPLFIELKLNKRTIQELGLRWNVQFPEVAVAAVSFGLVSGIIAYANNQAVISMQALPAGVLILLLYNNDFLEEFYHRGVIQTKLERVFGQGRAIFYGGILFGLTHVVFDFQMLMGSQGILFVILAFVMQVESGWLLGIVFMKTRSLWPGVACHYLANWLPAILTGLFS